MLGIINCANHIHVKNEHYHFSKLGSPPVTHCLSLIITALTKKYQTQPIVAASIPLLLITSLNYDDTATKNKKHYFTQDFGLAAAAFSFSYMSAISLVNLFLASFRFSLNVGVSNSFSTEKSSGWMWMSFTWINK